jgi:hypothetical protein
MAQIPGISAISGLAAVVAVERPVPSGLPALISVPTDIVAAEPIQEISKNGGKSGPISPRYSYESR